MPDYIDPAWEYFQADPEVEELMGGREARGFQGLRDERLDRSQSLGLRFGRGDPDAFWPRLSSPRKADRADRDVLRHRPCKGCGGFFLPDREARRYCCEECRPRPGAPRRLPDVQCPSCGTRFRPREAGHVYCSRQCQCEGQTRRLHETGCPWCGGEVGESTSRNGRPKKYCCAECKKAVLNYNLRRRNKLAS